MWKILISGCSDKLYIQLLRYVLVGGGAFIVDFLTLWAFTELFDVYYLVSAAIAFPIGLAVNYFLSTLWIFNRHTLRSKWAEVLIFSVIGLIGLGLNELFMFILTEVVHIFYLVSKIGATILVFAWNFVMKKTILFR